VRDGKGWHPFEAFLPRVKVHGGQLHVTGEYYHRALSIQYSQSCTFAKLGSETKRLRLWLWSIKAPLQKSKKGFKFREQLMLIMQ